MYIAELNVENFRQFGEGSAALQISFQPGVTALVGRNDSGKSAIIDAIRYALLTRDQEFIRVQPEDFHIDNTGSQASEILVTCRLAGLTNAEKGAFIEYLSYEGDQTFLCVNWSVRKLSEAPGARRWIDVSVRSGVDGTGPRFEASARELLAATYLRPLRDAEREMSPGRRSRLSQILSNVPEIEGGESFDESNIPLDSDAVERLSLVGLADYMRHSVRYHTGVGSAEEAINEQYLASLALRGDDLKGKIDVSEGGTEPARLRQILEKLELGLLNAVSGTPEGRYGLGSNNLLFMACELLLLGKEPDGLPLLLIEEPEAHLHPQRQLRLMEFLRKAADETIEESRRSVQVLLTTHSPNLASKIPLENIVLLQGGRAYSLAKSETKLEEGDYRFLERFLDVTKANLFFAHGVLIVEGDAEAILLPVLAQLIGNNLTERGISIVNVGGKGLRRFSRIFQSQNADAPHMDIPVACLADMDVMPDCAPVILGLVEDENDPKWQSNRRRWKAMRDFGDDEQTPDEALAALRQHLKADDGQSVKTFVADYWTLEYDLARSGLAAPVFTAAILAKNDDPLNLEKKSREDVIVEAGTLYEELDRDAGGDPEIFCSHIHRLFHSGTASKAVAAQYLAELLPEHCRRNAIDTAAFRALLPAYLVDAIDYLARPSVPQGPTRATDGGDNG